jgi:hypothetical protein
VIDTSAVKTAVVIVEELICVALLAEIVEVATIVEEEVTGIAFLAEEVKAAEAAVEALRALPRYKAAVGTNVILEAGPTW